MCSVFEIKKVSGKDLESVAKSIATNNHQIKLIRRTDTAPVFMAGSGIKAMRWGYERAGLGVINNTRSENLISPMWRDSIQNRRCLIPLLSFYEWSGPKTNKRTHRFSSNHGPLLWAAGIWEASNQLGYCFSMLTTAANRLMEPIHHRMPALLTTEECELFLEGKMRSFSPDNHMLVVEDAPNPLKKKTSSEIQCDLFDL